MTQHPQYVFVVPILPDDSSCANIRNAHFNMANMWVLMAILFAQAGSPRKYNRALLQAKIHAHVGETYGEIAELGWFMENLMKM